MEGQAGGQGKDCIEVPSEMTAATLVFIVCCVWLHCHAEVSHLTTDRCPYLFLHIASHSHCRVLQ
jgi:hypothetical protein